MPDRAEETHGEQRASFSNEPISLITDQLRLLPCALITIKPYYFTSMRNMGIKQITLLLKSASHK